MSKRTIFISCGQYTNAEKALGKAIVKMVDEIPELQAYFAEEVQDLNGLVTNILTKLHECEAFITVMHPRGAINRPDGPALIRASVWIEQEIAIATYIRQMENRPLPVIAFKHRSVCLEGIRSLVQLNPIEFTQESEVLAALPGLLGQWKGMPATGIRPQIKTTTTMRHHDGHGLRELQFSIVNDSAKRIREISGQLRIPAGILTHRSLTLPLEVVGSSDDHRYRIFRFDEKDVEAIQPRTTRRIATYEYCVRCGKNYTGETDVIAEALILHYEVQATFWIDGKEYTLIKTMKELWLEATGA
jgi:hypothetical protein